MSRLWSEKAPVEWQKADALSQRVVIVAFYPASQQGRCASRLLFGRGARDEGAHTSRRIDFGMPDCEKQRLPLRRAQFRWGAVVARV
jgi:hypothetical protein